MQLKPNTMRLYKVKPSFYKDLEDFPKMKFVAYHAYGPDEGGPWETFSDDADSFDPNDAEEENNASYDIDETHLEFIREEKFT